jgi:hypothetical protein
MPRLRPIAVNVHHRDGLGESAGKEPIMAAGVLHRVTLGDVLADDVK